MVGRFIGGEAGHRGFFGGTKGGPRTVGLLVSAGAGLVMVMYWGAPGLILGAVACVLVYVATMTTHRGSLLERYIKRSRWKYRVKTGTDRFEPYTELAWDDAQNRAGAVRGRAKKTRTLNAVRQFPDGADGMGWLVSGPRRPGVAWHQPAGEAPYLSVVFQVSGQLRGNAGEREQAQALEGFEKLLSGSAPASKLVSGVASMTRVLPPDLVLNELWVQENLDPQAPPAAVASYEDVLAKTGNGSFVQLHFIIIRWLLTPQFKAEAARYGQGRDGWRALISHEIQTMHRTLTGPARFRDVRALSARQTAAVIIHQQNPDWPIAMVRGVDVTRLGVRSRDEWAAHVCTATNPVTGQEVQWWHRTAAITADNVQTGERTQFWLLALLHGAGAGTRTVTFPLELVPSSEAALLARKDLTRTLSDQHAQQDKGQLVNQEVTAGARAAQMRRNDLAPGTGVHGANWAGFVTVSARSKAELHQACRRLEETATDNAGITRLDWLDTYQSAASGTTWPIFRGLAVAKRSAGSRALDKLAGKAGTEEKVNA